jgi:NAD(P)-dependent dehydrogenase (short-subunit alcohol dehydrogenase family)
VEGQFSQGKTSYHPHTNMAKAALNMLTYSSAPDYAEAGIYMNAVDPGWISHQTPNMTPEIEEGRVPLPLDMVDAAARVCDPVFTGVGSGEYRYGKFLKDYGEVSW